MIGDKADACIIRGPKLLPPSLRRKMNQFNELHSEEPNWPPREWNIQTTEVQLKSRICPPKTSCVVSDIKGRLNHYTIDNGDFEVHPLDFPVEFKSEYIPYQYTTTIKSIDDDEMDRILKFFHL